MFLTRCPQPARVQFAHHPAARRVHLTYKKRVPHSKQPPAPVRRVFAHLNEHEDKVELSIDVPGIKANDLTVNVENRVLTISGNRTVSSAGNRINSSSWKFSRQFALDTTVDVDNLSANLVDGVLTITAPKIEKPDPIQVAITEEQLAALTSIEDSSAAAEKKSKGAPPSDEVDPEAFLDIDENVVDGDDEVIMVETVDADDMDEDDIILKA